MRNVIKIAVSLLLALTATGAVTKPDRQKHVDEIADRMLVALATADINAMDDVVGEISPRVIQLMDRIINGSLDMKDMVIFNVGALDLGNGKENISVGAFGHVFTFIDNGTTKMGEEVKTLLDQVINQQ